ncbi:carbohydrate binding domain-containing protein [Streptomyces sp. NPDC056580]|uniref:carbohydrate binding domain-containing protein n=1 Tax=Streptomyces sp. NPDC056580 TaxID=3345872 RepID=UPI00368E10E7
MTSGEASDRPLYSTETSRRRIHAIARTAGGRTFRAPAGSRTTAPGTRTTDQLGTGAAHGDPCGPAKPSQGDAATGLVPARAGWVEKAVDLGAATTSQATFDNGNDGRDNDNGANYRLPKGGSRVEDRTVTANADDPCTTAEPDTASASANATVTATAAAAGVDSHALVAPGKMGTDGPHLEQPPPPAARWTHRNRCSPGREGRANTGCGPVPRVQRWNMGCPRSTRNLLKVMCS